MSCHCHLPWRWGPAARIVDDPIDPAQPSCQGRQQFWKLGSEIGRPGPPRAVDVVRMAVFRLQPHWRWMVGGRRFAKSVRGLSRGVRGGFGQGVEIVPVRFREGLGLVRSCARMCERLPSWPVLCSSRWSVAAEIIGTRPVPDSASTARDAVVGADRYAVPPVDAHVEVMSTL